MSSSDDDSEFYDASPEVPVAPSRNVARRKAASPQKVPKKKQVLSDFNVALEDSDSDDYVMDSEEEEEDGGRKRGRASVGVNGTKKKGSENMPPPPPPASTASFISNANIPEESSQPVNNGEQQVRARKRLSIRSDGSALHRRSSMSSAVESVVATPSEVQTIYETCSQMFTANRINPQNAFNLRLLDCINQMINSPNYDKSNMLLTSSTVEIGTKIYVCRVDNTHSQVLSLASDMAQVHRKKRKDGGADDGSQMDEDGGMPEGADDDPEDAEDRPRQRQKKQKIKKRGKFVEEDNSKLLTGLEEQNVKFVTRRNFLKKKFNEMIFDDLDFDYQSYFLEPEDAHPLQTQNEEVKMNEQRVIPETYVNQIEFGRLDYLPYNHLSKFDAETYDIWGRPLNEQEINRAELTQGPQIPVDDMHAYDPDDRPAEYPDEGGHEGGGMTLNDTLGEALAPLGEGEELPPVSFHDIRSLDNLDAYFQRIRSLLKESKSKYGWCGPNFVRPKTTWGNQPKGAKKPKVRKEPEPVDCLKIDWTDKNNKYTANQSGRTVFDDKIIEDWNTQRVVIPFLGIELNTYDDEFDPADFENESDPKYVPAIFKLFCTRNRSILDLLKIASKRGRKSSGNSVGPNHFADDGFDNDNDIELPRDVVEDFCSQPANEEGFHLPDTQAQDAAWQDPTSIPGLLNENDPMSAVSDVDSIRFSRKPKPIDMSVLKKAILKCLAEKLSLSDDGKPLKVEVTSIGFGELMFHVLSQIGSRLERIMSVSIFLVALMHVVADKRLFVLYEGDPDCPVVICRGKNFKHKDHIPMPEDGFD